MKAKLSLALYWFTVGVLFLLIGLVAYRLIVWPAVGETVAPIRMAGGPWP